MYVMGGEHHPANTIGADAGAGPGNRKRADHSTNGNEILTENEGDLLIFDDIWSYDLTTGAWAYEAGDCDIPNLANSTHGVKGIPSLMNSPQSRYGGNAWTDKAGNAWIFGGGYTGYTNDVWSFAPTNRV